MGTEITIALKRLSDIKTARLIVDESPPDPRADVTIALNATTDCSAQGAICTEDGGKLSGGFRRALSNC